MIGLLRRKPSSRKAVIQLFDAQDILEEHSDIPCTCTIQFMIRRDRLDMFTNMRSNDAFWGLPHDVFCFTMLQEIVARSLSVEIGSYKHAAGSLHLYEPSIDAAERFIEEGWQPTEAVMPPMPIGDPWPSISTLLKAESGIRSDGTLPGIALEEPDPYWADLIRLLQVFRYKKDKDADRIKETRSKIEPSSSFISIRF